MSIKTSGYSFMLVAFAALFGINVATAGEVTLADTTPFSDNSVIRDAVKNDCQLQTKLPGFVQEFASKYGVDVKLAEGTPNKSKGRVLMLEIVGVEGSGGGAWSGAKSVQVKGELFDNGKLIGDFMASRYSGGGAFAGFKGTCSILGRCVKTLGKDIGNWLQNPTRKARLGDF